MAESVESVADLSMFLAGSRLLLDPMREDAPMRGLVQRVDGARVVVDGDVVGAIEGPGLCVLVGVTHSDTSEIAHRLADKVHQLRIFDDPTPAGADASGRTVERSAAELRLPILVISQFTLYGSARKGRRPTWDQAAGRAIAEPLVSAVVQRLRDRGAQVAEGRFGDHMRVELVNDGPFTVMVEVD